MGTKISPVMVVVIVVLAIVGVGLMGYKMMAGSKPDTTPAVVKIANPDDPHLKPNLPPRYSGAGGN